MTDDLTTQFRRKADTAASEAEAALWREASRAAAERDTLRAQRDAAAAVAVRLWCRLFEGVDGQAADWLRPVIAEWRADPGKAAQLAALVFGEEEQRDG